MCVVVSWLVTCWWCNILRNISLFWLTVWYVYNGLRVCWPVRPEKTCSEERRSYVRPTKQREAVCVTIDSYIQAGICDCDVLFVLARDKCTDLVDILIICFVFNKLLFILYLLLSSIFFCALIDFIHLNSRNNVHFLLTEQLQENFCSSGRDQCSEEFCLLLQGEYLIIIIIIIIILFLSQFSYHACMQQWTLKDWWRIYWPDILRYTVTDCGLRHSKKTETQLHQSYMPIVNDETNSLPCPPTFIK